MINREYKDIRIANITSEHTPILILNEDKNLAYGILGNHVNLSKGEIITASDDDVITFVRYMKRNVTLKVLFHYLFCDLNASRKLYKQQLNKYGKSIFDLNNINSDTQELRELYRRLIHIYNAIDEKEDKETQLHGRIIRI